MITRESPALEILSSNAFSLSTSITAKRGFSEEYRTVVCGIEGAKALAVVTAAAATATVIRERTMVLLNSKVIGNNFISAIKSAALIHPFFSADLDS